MFSEAPKDAATVFEKATAAGDADAIAALYAPDAGDDRAIMLWSWITQIAPQGRPPVVTKGSSLVHWKRMAGAWQITMDMFQVLPP